MTLIRWNPVNEMLNLQREMNRLFTNFAPAAKSDEDFDAAVWSPRADVVEDADKYTVHFDMPGIDKSDVSIKFAAGSLVVSGERKTMEEKKDATTQRIERMYGKFYRSFTFPSAVNAEKISAEFSNGVLTVTIPKSEETKPRTIAIQ